MNDKELTMQEAYLAMISFLDQIYDRTKSDDLGAILGSMAILEDGKPADPAFSDDWEEAVESVMSQGSKDSERQ